MEFRFNYLNVLIFILILIHEGHALECYVCTRQERNADKCLHTIKTCEQEEEVCLTEIQWGSTPYWSQGAEKQYYISKRCAAKDACENTRSRYMRSCTHIWYEDWKCSECCKGDRCNYFVILGGSVARSSVVLTVVGLAAVWIIKNLL